MELGKINLKHLGLACVLASSVNLLACSSTSSEGALAKKTLQVPLASEILSPQAIEDNTGLYMSPYTSDEVVAEWVEKAIDADIGSDIGGLIGTHLGREVLSEIPFIGSTIGKNVGEIAGREIALDTIGGEAMLKESSDLSFNSLQDMAVYLYKHNSRHPNYVDVVKATMVIYPELKAVYNKSILTAPRW